MLKAGYSMRQSNSHIPTFTHTAAADGETYRASPEASPDASLGLHRRQAAKHDLLSTIVIAAYVGPSSELIRPSASAIASTIWSKGPTMDAEVTVDHG